MKRTVFIKLSGFRSITTHAVTLTAHTFADHVMISVLLQLDGSLTETPPSRSQKIARAKWEFLFGGRTEESGCRKGQFVSAVRPLGT